MRTTLRLVEVAPNTYALPTAAHRREAQEAYDRAPTGEPAPIRVIDTVGEVVA